jgi:hypothetical protein
MFWELCRFPELLCEFCNIGFYLLQTFSCRVGVYSLVAAQTSLSMSSLPTVPTRHSNDDPDIPLAEDCLYDHERIDSSRASTSGHFGVDVRADRNLPPKHAQEYRRLAGYYLHNINACKLSFDMYL